jgi:hypothetical protein
VSSLLLVREPSLSSPFVTTLSMKRCHHYPSKPSHDFLASCVLLLMRETQPQVHFWLVDKLSRVQPCLALCRFTQVLLKSGFARRKVLLPPRVAREPNYNILSERMAYYSGYVTGKKCVMLRFSLLQLVTSEPEFVDILKAPLKQSLLWSFHVPATWHSIANMYPSPTQYVSAFDHHMGMFLGFCRGPSLAPSCLGCVHWSSRTLHLWLANQVHDTSNHALKLCSKDFTLKRCSLLTLWAGHHLYFGGLSAEG